MTVALQKRHRAPDHTFGVGNVLEYVQHHDSVITRGAAWLAHPSRQRSRMNRQSALPSSFGGLHGRLDAFGIVALFAQVQHELSSPRTNVQHPAGARRELA